jgi:hypothetical protein
MGRIVPQPSIQGLVPGHSEKQSHLQVTIADVRGYVCVCVCVCVCVLGWGYKYNK